MKSILLGMMVLMSALFSAQYYSNNGWNDNNQYNGYGNDQYFPEDYYYEYPTDYYGDGYYQDYYNDYQQSINMVNWNRFFRDMALTAYQINLIMDLNRQFASYNVWNNYYRVNPVRWYYDRYFALERILGPQVFVVFQNQFYNGYNPVIFYTNRCRNYYRPRYRVRPVYAGININIYRVNRQDYHRNVGRNFGWNQPRNNNYGFRNSGHPSENNRSGNRNSSFRGDRSNGNNGNNGIRNTRSVRSSSPSTANTQSPRSNSGVRNSAPSANAQPRMNTTPRSSSPRNTVSPRSSERSNEPRGFRNNSSSERRSPAATQQRSRGNSEQSSGNRSGNFRGRLTSN